MSHSSLPIANFAKSLRQLETWLDAAVAYSKSKKFDESVLLASRLAPDQFPLVRQIQSACDTAKFGVARLAGQKAPIHPDTEVTVEELKTRIRAVVEYLETFDAVLLEEGAERRITLPWVQGKYLVGRDYVQHFALPNFYFHVTTAYAILRHIGVPLGKTDFLGPLPFHDA